MRRVASHYSADFEFGSAGETLVKPAALLIVEKDLIRALAPWEKPHFSGRHRPISRVKTLNALGIGHSPISGSSFPYRFGGGVKPSLGEQILHVAVAKAKCHLLLMRQTAISRSCSVSE
jgi:hypothetical protein